MSWPAWVLCIALACVGLIVIARWVLAIRAQLWADVTELERQRADRGWPS